MRALPLSALLGLLFTGCVVVDAASDKDSDAVIEGSDEDGDGYLIPDGDCDETDATIHPGAIEVCDGIDNNCDGLIDEGLQTPFWPDTDGDGYGDDAATALDACEPPDGFVEQVGDCDDANRTIHPDADEACNQLDDNCDGEIDEGLGETRWVDADRDGYGDPGAPQVSCAGEDYLVDNDRDCDDTDEGTSPEADELCDERDNDCDGTVDEGVTTDFYADVDGDEHGDATVIEPACVLPAGYAVVDDDCNDGDATVHPGADETCDGVDEDCDGVVDDGAIDIAVWYADGDGDGYGAGAAALACDAPTGHVATDGDCDDTVATTNPGATELCNGSDDDCNGTVDEDTAADAATWYGDADGDGYGASTFTTISCDQPAGYEADVSDCDDLDADVFPGAPESCDGTDEDCNGVIDDNAYDPSSFYADADSDGYGDASVALSDCTAPAGYVADATDCDDAISTINPGARETCDGIDEDCDGSVDNGVTVYTWYADVDGDSYGDASITADGCAAPGGYLSNDDDCDDGDATINPLATETCDGVDEDCDSVIDDGLAVYSWYADADGDTYGDATAEVIECSAPAGHVADADDCDDADPAINPAAIELCDGLDQDCDTVADDGVATTAWYLDGDLDGFGDASTSTVTCAAPSGYVSDDNDCDDADITINPAATETCDGVDEDCDGTIDDGVTTTTWYLDVDGDGYGDAATTYATCGTPAGYVSNDDDCDDDNALLFPEADGTCPDGLDCEDILASGKSTGNGTYTVDPDGSGTGTDPFDVLCEMTLYGGGWTQAIQDYLDTMDTSTSRNYLYSYGSNWYVSPSTTYVWSWSSYQYQNGTYGYGTGSTLTSTFSCTHAEGGGWGVGCSNGGGGTYKVLPIYYSDAAAATSMICQDRPDVYGAGACRSNVSIWARE